MRKLLILLLFIPLIACGKNPTSPSMNLPIISNFSVDSNIIAVNTTTVLRWTVTSGTCTGSQADCSLRVSITPGLGDVTASGSAVIAPLITTIYTLYAYNAAGSVNRQLTVIVK